MDNDKKQKTYSNQWYWCCSDEDRQTLIFKRDATWVVTRRKFDAQFSLWDFPDEKSPSDVIFRKYESAVDGRSRFADKPYGLITGKDGRRYVNVPPDFKSMKPTEASPDA